MNIPQPSYQKTEVKNQTIWEKLSAPFPAFEVEWKPISTWPKESPKKALLAAFIDARSVMDRLDEVLGNENWSSSFTKESGGYLCSIGIKVKDDWVFKMDGAQDTANEPFKGGISDSFKRAAVQWGIGRYLYSLPTHSVDLSETSQHGMERIRINKKNYYYWRPKT